MARLLFDSTETELYSFWCSIMQSYQKLSTKALSILVPLATAYFCVCRFSSLFIWKTSMNTSNNLRVALS